MNKSLERMKCHFSDEGYDIQHLSDYSFRVKKGKQLVYDIWAPGDQSTYTVHKWADNKYYKNVSEEKLCNNL